MGYSPLGRKESDITKRLNSNSKSFLPQSSPQIWLNTGPNLTVRDQKLCPQLPGKPDTCKGWAAAEMGSSLVAQRLKRLPAMQETWVRSLGWEDPLEKEMAPHSSTLAWKIPWMKEPGGLQSKGSQRVRHD